MVLVGSKIAGLVSGPGGIGDHAQIVCQYPDFQHWVARAAEVEADIILIECATLFAETVQRIEELTTSNSTPRPIIIYHFAQKAALELLAQKTRTITAMRAPVTPSDLKTACEADLALAMIRSHSPEFPSDTSGLDDIPDVQQVENIPARQFDDVQLSKISNISTAVDCECPHHMASILAELNAFEKYSQECENKNADDEALHHLLHHRTAQARSIMEDALAILMEAEGIDIES